MNLLILIKIIIRSKRKIHGNILIIVYIYYIICYYNNRKELKDPKGSNLTYYWNTETNETTPLGAAKPRHWIQIYDNNNNLSYWWDPESNETTALGAPKPIDTIHNIGNISSHSNYNNNDNSKSSFGSMIVTYMTLGIGMTVGMTLVRVILGF